MMREIMGYVSMALSTRTPPNNRTAEDRNAAASHGTGSEASCFKKKSHEWRRARAEGEKRRAKQAEAKREREGIRRHCSLPEKHTYLAAFLYSEIGIFSMHSVRKTRIEQCTSSHPQPDRTISARIVFVLFFSYCLSAPEPEFLYSAW